MALSDNILALRKQHHLAQADVADALQISRDAYGKYERGERDVSSAVLLKLADFYGVSTDAMFGRSAMETAQEDEDTILGEFDKLPEKAQELMLQLMDILIDTAADRYPTIMARLHKSLASAGFGYDLSDSDEWEEIRILDNPTARRADFAVKVEGDSMEPDFSDGDIVLIKQTPDIEVGQVGLFVHDGKGYIKEYGETCLVSRNPRYPNITGESMTVGVVLGRAQVV